MRKPTESDIPMHGWIPYSEFHRERIRAMKKHEANGKSVEAREYNDAYWMPILAEEVGEVARVICDDESPERLREELVQVGAMAAAWIDAIDDFRRSRDQLIDATLYGDTTRVVRTYGEFEQEARQARAETKLLAIDAYKARGALYDLMDSIDFDDGYYRCPACNRYYTEFNGDHGNAEKHADGCPLAAAFRAVRALQDGERVE